MDRANPTESVPPPVDRSTPVSTAEPVPSTRATEWTRPAWLTKPTLTKPTRTGGRVWSRLSTPLWLVAAVVLGAAVSVEVPRTGLDPSWAAALNIAAAEGRHFGNDLLFTFGPWGFLDHPLSVDGRQFALGLLFGIAATAALFGAAHVCLRHTWGPAVAAPLAFAVTLVRPVTEPGMGILCAGLLLALRAVARRPAPSGYGWRDTWPTALLTASAALLAQVKFSEGVVLGVLAGIVAVRGPTRRALARNLGVATATFPATFLAGWLLAGQPLATIPGWLRGSWELASGYSEAMATGGFHEARSHLAAALLVSAAGWLTGRMVRHRERLPAVGLLLVVSVAVVFGYKHGFIRHDAYHEPTFFMVLAFLLVALARYARRPAAVLVVVALAVAAVPRPLAEFDPVAAVDRWRASGTVLLDDDHRLRTLERGAGQARARYQLPAAMVAATRGHPVSVEPWEATLPWAYAMNWNPVPVFQAYAAYTPYLDEANARALASAPADQIVLREDRAPIDDRNRHWETPRYQLTLACEYTTDLREGRWSLLRHADDRCAGPRTLGTRAVGAGERVDTPAAGPDEILLARFTPRPDGILRTLTDTLLKDRSPFLVRADGRRYRLPERLAGGPLMVSFPDVPGGALPFDAFRYRQLAFSKDGTVEFQVVTVD